MGENTDQYGEIIKDWKVFDLKFRHINSKVTVQKASQGYMAFIAFPKAYRFDRGRYRHALPFITAGNLQYACEMAANEFKMFYKALDAPIRLIGAFNFFVQRILFRTAVERSVGDFKAQFVITRQFYGISENVDGIKFPKSTFYNRENTTSRRVLFFINYVEVFYPIHLLGFNDKFIQRLLYKHDRVKENRLRLYDDRLFVDDLANKPGLLINHVADHRQEFYMALDWEKAKRMFGNDL